MKRWQSELYCTAFKKEQLPPSCEAEIVLAGRSNVGKSTLINALLGQDIAKVSSKPGKTRSINFYSVNTADAVKFMLVDLPGYGYAARDVAERMAWWNLIEDYFSSQRRILFVIHLIDFRHGPLANDVELTAWLDKVNMNRLVVFTKGDKISTGKRKQMYKQYVSNGIDSVLPPYVTSGIDNDEMDSLRKGIILAKKEIESIG
jgi:GTP-binding protein